MSFLIATNSRMVSGSGRGSGLLLDRCEHIAHYAITASAEGAPVAQVVDDELIPVETARGHRPRVAVFDRADSSHDDGLGIGSGHLMQGVLETQHFLQLQYHGGGDHMSVGVDFPQMGSDEVILVEGRRCRLLPQPPPNGQ